MARRDLKYIHDFGDNLRILRKKRKISMSNLGSKCRPSMELNSIYRIEKGKVDISICTLRALANALEIHPTKLLDF